MTKQFETNLTSQLSFSYGRQYEKFKLLFQFFFLPDGSKTFVFITLSKKHFCISSWEMNRTTEVFLFLSVNSFLEKFKK